MTRFAEFREREESSAAGRTAPQGLPPGAGGALSPDLAVRPLRREDLVACAQLAADREGEGLPRWIESFERALRDECQLTLVAAAGEEILGYGKAGHLDPRSRGGRGMPTGWYLSGLVVRPDQRRRGWGRRLTEARVQTLVSRGVEEVWYFAAAVNTVSLDLHAGLGFVEVTRDFQAPWVSFTGGEGVLSVWRRPGFSGSAGPRTEACPSGPPR
ncbi:N-acetyltransferase family protein [Ornithinimicrobium sp. Y1847]|uniref:GNAT family N-acetyltransferase n=1 Tax=Ornithinimicrobium sp. Y1847 TaxID=3405419 RepID=UPI003B679470